MKNQALSNLELGKSLGGISHTTVADWLSGARPRQKAALRLAEFFGVPVSVLLDDSQELPTVRDLAYARQVAANARRSFPKNLAAAQANFETRMHQREMARKTFDFVDFLRGQALALRAQADALDKHADSLEKAAVDPARR